MRRTVAAFAAWCGVWLAACGWAHAAPPPAVLTGVESFASAPAAESYAGASLFADDEMSAADPAETFVVRWWMNPAPVDKRGVVLLFSCTREAFPDRILDIPVPLSEAAQGNQTANVAIPPGAGRVVSWRALLLQRGRPLSSLKSPDWSAYP